MALWQNYEASPELLELCTTAKESINDCQDILKTFRDKVDQKYRISLAASGSGSWVRDAGKKFLWLKEKDDVLELKRRLHRSSESITMLALAAMGYVTHEPTLEIKRRKYDKLISHAIGDRTSWTIQLKHREYKPCIAYCRILSSWLKHSSYSSKS